MTVPAGDAEGARSGSRPLRTGPPGADIDLTATEPEGPTQEELSPLPTRPYSLARQQEDMRGRMALALIGLLAFVVAAAFVSLWVEGGLAEGTKDLLTLVLGPVVTLVGSVIGYYFGGQVREARERGPER